mmetsp:Transcript_11817/g.47678  ORF Transcript_11817/g.47678 Transcript_11817/m.47678 type:complete len:288 (-) Transcript_11817:188-1051(-)
MNTSHGETLTSSIFSLGNHRGFVHCEAMGSAWSFQRRLPRGHIVQEPYEGGTNTNRVVERHLGSGSYGDVYEVKNGATLEAMKMVVMTDAKGFPMSDEERIRRLRPHVLEAHTMLKLGKHGRHPNLVNILEAFQVSNQFYFFMDLVPGGRTLEKVMNRLTSSQSEFIALEMARGLANMHHHDVYHWDVKPANVLVELVSCAGAPLHFHARSSCTTACLGCRDTSETTGAVKLTDFGGGFTPAYASPETRRLLAPSRADTAVSASGISMLSPATVRISGAWLSSSPRC